MVRLPLRIISLPTDSVWPLSGDSTSVLSYKLLGSGLRAQIKGLTWRAKERREGAGGWMEGGTGGSWELQRRRGSLALNGTAGLQILDPWCPGFQSGGGTEREERRCQDDTATSEQRKRNPPKKCARKRGWHRREGSALIHALCASHCNTDLYFMKPYKWQRTQMHI